MGSVTLRLSFTTILIRIRAPAGIVFWRRCICRGCQKVMEVMIIMIIGHSGCQYLYHRLLLPAIINFLSQSDGEGRGGGVLLPSFSPKKSGCTILTNLPVYINFVRYQYCSYCTTTVVLHYLALQHHCCIVICIASMKYCL